MEEDQEYPEEDLEDDETGYSLYVEQDDLEIVRAWFEEIRAARIDEANRLEVELAQAERDIREFLEELENVDAWKSERGHIEWTNGEVRERRINVERYYRMLRDKRDFARRQLRDLVKQDREDIEWMWKLERNQRERQERERNTYKPTTTSQKRAAEWKERKSKG